MKEESIGKPNIYLGNKVSKVTLENGVHAWAFSSARYIKSAVQNVKDYLKLKKLSLPSKANAPMSSGYRPELDTSNELNPSEAAYYQSLIGILRWIVELGDPIYVWKFPCWHHIWPFLVEGTLINSIVYLPIWTNITTQKLFSTRHLLKSLTTFFEKHDWLHTVYGNCHEEMPYDAPTPRGNDFIMRAYVDSDHAGDSTNR